MRNDSERTSEVAAPSPFCCDERKLLDRKINPARGYDADLLCSNQNVWIHRWEINLNAIVKTIEWRMELKIIEISNLPLVVGFSLRRWWGISGPAPGPMRPSLPSSWLLAASNFHRQPEGTNRSRLDSNLPKRKWRCYSSSPTCRSIGCCCSSPADVDWMNPSIVFHWFRTSEPFEWGRRKFPSWRKR